MFVFTSLYICDNIKNLFIGWITFTYLNALNSLNCLTIVRFFSINSVFVFCISNKIMK